MNNVDHVLLLGEPYQLSVPRVYREGSRLLFRGPEPVFFHEGRPFEPSPIDELARRANTRERLALIESLPTYEAVVARLLDDTR
jgi:hypothetical protein